MPRSGRSRPRGPLRRRRRARGRRRRRGREWAERALERRGGYVIVVARFVPGGRTAATLTAGLTEMRWARFARLAGLAAVFWGSYAGLLGYVGGRTFEDDPWRALLLALALAGAILLGVEGLERIRRSRPEGRAYCAGAFGVREGVEQAGIRLLDDYKQHPSIRSYVVDGYQVLTF